MRPPKSASPKRPAAKPKSKPPLAEIGDGMNALFALSNVYLARGRLRYVREHLVEASLALAQAAKTFRLIEEDLDGYGHKVDALTRVVNAHRYAEPRRAKRGARA